LQVCHSKRRSKAGIKIIVILAQPFVNLPGASMQDIKDTYLTINAPSESIFKDRGSKFLAFAYEVYSEDDIKDRLAELRKTYYDARHHCYAYQLGYDGAQFRTNDDGEPGHSAGDPILGQIRSRQLTNVLVVVVRYFGGTKLGVSGLIHAYKTAAADALDASDIVERIMKDRVIIAFDYLQMNDVMKLIKEHNLEMLSQQFDNSCSITLEVRKNLTQLLVSQLDTIPGLSFSLNNQ
jgi:uncharacterized YigZ family protein